MGNFSTVYAIFVVIILTTATESITTTFVLEGNEAFLNFTYSCNSTKVTLRHSYRAPFYDSRSSTLPSSPKLKLKNETDGKVCFLYLTINPFTRDDEGGYILTAYKDDPTQYEDDRILLLVGYPPDKASCALSEEHTDEDGIRLHCTAHLGNVSGFITCYQNGIKIPSLNSPENSDQTLHQTLLAKLGHLVYCCSSALNQTKDKCDCKDSVWDPTQNKQVTNVTDPCTRTVSTVQYPPFSKHLSEHIELESASPRSKAFTVTTQQIHSGKTFDGLIVGICVVIPIVSLTALGIVYYHRRHQKKLSNSTKNPENSVKVSFIPHDDSEKV